MESEQGKSRPALKAIVCFVVGVTFVFGLLESCDNRLIGLTRYIDPCGTILSCPPGSFEASRAEINDPCIDPACVVPGGCGGGTPLGTIRDLPGC